MVAGFALFETGAKSSMQARSGRDVEDDHFAGAYRDSSDASLFLWQSSVVLQEMLPPPGEQVYVSPFTPSTVASKVVVRSTGWPASVT